RLIETEHPLLGNYYLYCEAIMPSDEVLFTNNDTNMQKLFGVPNATPYVKDAFHEYLVHGNHRAVNPARMGTKAGALYKRIIAAGATFTLRLRLTKVTNQNNQLTDLASPFADFDAMFKMRQQEADEYYAALQPAHLDEDQRSVHRQALAGMLWNKQFYH